MRGIKINDLFHTGYDLNMVMTRKDLPPPEVQTFIVEIPGRNGLLDMSEALTGEPTYKNRALTFGFIGNGSRDEVLNLIETILRYHNQYLTIVVDDYENWYFEGRAKVSYTDHYHWVEFELVIDAQPFRYALEPRIYSGNNLSNTTVTLDNMGVSVIPTITVSAETTIVFKDTTLKLNAGTYEDEKLKLSPGENTFTITTTGSVVINYREAVI